MKSTKLSWYQTGMISLIGVFFLGNWAIDKEYKRVNPMSIRINMPDLSRNSESILAFDLDAVDRLKSSLQINISIDSLEKISPIIRESKQKYDTTHVLTIHWKETTKLQQFVALMDTLEREGLKRYAIVPNDTKCMVSLYFPKPTKEFFDCMSGCCLPFYYPEPPPKTFQQNFNMIFKDYIQVWILFIGLITCTLLKIKRK